MSAKVAETAKAEVERVRQQAAAGAKSGAYIYPIKGIFFFLSHRDLWKPLLARLPSTMTLGIGVTTFMFAFTYLPQVAIQFFTSGPLAALTTVLLVLSESSTLTMVLSKAFLIEDSLIDTFDGTLVARGQPELVAKQRQVKSSGTGDAIARLGKLASKPFAKFTPQAIIRYFMYLPLNFIPVVGTVIFILLQGKRNGPNAHARYYQLKGKYDFTLCFDGTNRVAGMSQTQKEKQVEDRRGAYTGFGVAATLLEMIPIAGIFFAFTNTCAAALWAADMEQNQGTSPALREQAKKAECS